MTDKLIADLARMADLKDGTARVSFAMTLIREELGRTMAAFPPMHSAHEGFAVLKEEVDELWDQVKVNQKRHDLVSMTNEAIQVAAMALRFAVDVCRPDVVTR